MAARVQLKKSLVVSLKVLDAKMNRLAVNRKSQSNFDVDFYFCSVESQFCTGVREEITSAGGRGHCWSRYQETSSNRLRTLDCAL
jgi:hypothetical protein